jgi:tRNA pseudouridine-54 N-methylase
VKFLRPDERALAVLARKVLASVADEGPGFVEVKPGVDVARGGLERVLSDLSRETLYVLEEGAPDLRDVTDLARGDQAFFLGDPAGFDASSRDRLKAAGARAVSVGPVSLHAEDVVTIVSNELDRRG